MKNTLWMLAESKHRSFTMTEARLLNAARNQSAMPRMETVKVTEN